MKRTFASLFTGFGGADVGAFDAGYTPIWGVEFDPAIAAVAQQNGAHVLVDDVRKVNYNALAAPDLLHASPVCKNASIAKQDGKESVEDIETADAVIRAIRTLKPRAFTLENVRGYREFQAFKNILAALHGQGYAIAVDVLNSADYGVPQTRERLFVIARRDGKRPVFPAHTHSPSDEISPMFDHRKPYVGWLESIADLVDQLPDTEFAPWQLERMPAHLKSWAEGFILSGENSGSESYNERGADEPAFVVSASQKGATRAFIVDGQPAFGVLAIREGGQPIQTIAATQLRRPLRAFLATTDQVICEWTVRYGDQPAMTVKATAMHRPITTPAAGVNGRVVKMSPRCLARFQSFPDTYILPDKPSLAVRGIGNAVPPLLYQRIAESLK